MVRCRRAPGRRARLCSAIVRNPFASPLWRNHAFLRVWSAASISIFGSLITRFALPIIAILALHAGPFEVAMVRSIDLLSALLVGFVAGAWVDRLRRRPVLIWADLGRALVLLSIPVSFVLGTLQLWQLIAVAALAAVLTTFFDAADNAYLPTIVERERLLEANSALAASGSVVEFVGFGISGVLVQLLTGPITILIDVATYLISAALLFSVRTAEAPAPPRADREPVLDEIREGIRLVRHDRLLRPFLGAQMLMSTLWGIFGATWFLFALEELDVSPAMIGVVAGLGGASSFVGAVVAMRVTKRWGVGPVAVGALLVAALGNLFIPLAPAGAPLLAVVFLSGQQLLGDSAITVYDVTETSVKQARVADRELGRVSSIFHVGSAAAQFSAALGAGLLAEVIGLRATAFLAPFGALLAAGVLYWSPVRTLRDLPRMDARSPAQVVVDVERDQPVGA
jgi:MFS family permease